MKKNIQEVKKVTAWFGDGPIDHFEFCLAFSLQWNLDGVILQGMSNSNGEEEWPSNKEANIRKINFVAI